jgi:hypothetical protein
METWHLKSNVELPESNAKFAKQAEFANSVFVCLSAILLDEP